MFIVNLHVCCKCCYFNKDLNNADKLEWTQKHVPVSVSICSNVPEFTEPLCLISHGDPDDLVQRMMARLEDISAAAEANLMEDPEMEVLFNSIEQKLKEEEEETEEEEIEEDEENPPQEKTRASPVQTKSQTGGAFGSASGGRV